jgi:hypothetical protein
MANEAEERFFALKMSPTYLKLAETKNSVQMHRIVIVV